MGRMGWIFWFGFQKAFQLGGGDGPDEEVFGAGFDGVVAVWFGEGFAESKHPRVGSDSAEGFNRLGGFAGGCFGVEQDEVEGVFIEAYDALQGFIDAKEAEIYEPAAQQMGHTSVIAEQEDGGWVGGVGGEIF